MTNLLKKSIILNMEKTIVGIISSVLLAFIYLEKIHIDVGEETRLRIVEKQQERISEELLDTVK